MIGVPVVGSQPLDCLLTLCELGLRETNQPVLAWYENDSSAVFVTVWYNIGVRGVHVCIITGWNPSRIVIPFIIYSLY